MVAKMTKKSLHSRIWAGRNGYLFVAPFFVLYAVFGAYPFVFALCMSFSKYSPTKGFGEFMGFRNFGYVLGDRVFWKALLNTLWFVVFNIPVLIFCALGLAAVLNARRLKGRKFFQIACLLPYVTSSIAYGIVFFILFDSRIGLINAFLNSVGIPSVRWLDSADWTKATISIVIIWAWVGYNMLIMLGGLQNIDAELYDAAKVDGANAWHSFSRITVPMMRPVIYFTTISSTIGTFNMFNEPYILFGGTGGTENSAITLNMYLYSQSFKSFQLSIGAAVSFLMFVLIMLFSIPQVRNIFRPNT
jgi:ABC-type sugar transport system permease subunit